MWLFPVELDTPTQNKFLYFAILKLFYIHDNITYFSTMSGTGFRKDSHLLGVCAYISRQFEYSESG